MRTFARPEGRLLGAAALVLGLLVVPVSSWADTGGEVSVSNTRPQLGEEITVTGSNFNEGDTVSFRVCGAPDATGRLACTEAGDSLTVAFDGTVRGTLLVDEPSGACPCSVVVDSPAAPPVLTPINLVGHRVAKVVQAPDLVVDEATLTPTGGLGRWFGAAPDLTLTMTLRNAGVAPAEPTLDLVWRDGEDTPESIIDTGMPIVEPGERVEVEVPLTFGALAQGEHTVSGQVVVGDLYAPVVASTTLAPWGLYLLGFAGLGFAGLARAQKVGGPRTATGARVQPAPPHKIDERKPTVRKATDRKAGRRASNPENAPARLPVPVARAATSAPPVPTQAVPAQASPKQPVAAQAGPKPAQVETGTPAYIGPPRLESTPLSTLRRPGQAGTAPPPQGSTAVESKVAAPRIPLQASVSARKGTRPAQSAPAQSAPAQSAPAPDAAPHDSVRVVRSTTPEQDAATVANAMAAIQERSGTAPARLPANYEVAPGGKRAERGGKRAARPEKPQWWITRR